MALAEFRIQPQHETCCICWEELDIEVEHGAKIVPIDEDEVHYFYTTQECEGCAFGL